MGDHLICIVDRWCDCVSDIRRIKKNMKTLSELPSDKLQKYLKQFRYTFYIYIFMEVLFVIIAGWQGASLIQTVSDVSDSPIITMLLLFGVINIMNMFMIFVVWFCMESSYYKMLENQMDLMLYLRTKMGG